MKFIEFIWKKKILEGYVYATEHIHIKHNKNISAQNHLF